MACVVLQLLVNAVSLEQKTAMTAFNNIIKKMRKFYGLETTYNR